MRILFMGTPPVAVTALESLVEAGHSLVGVVAPPDRPSGRGRRTRRPPTAVWAEDRGVRLHQPAGLREREVIETLAGDGPEVVVVVSYGLLLPPAVLSLAPQGAINLHFSLLPRWRGAAPVQRCIEAGEEETGITTMRMDEGLDTGPILLQETVEIGPRETAPELEERLGRRGGPLLVRTLEGLADGSLEARPQDDGRATWAGAVRKEEGEVDWSRPARDLFNAWRAFQPWPGLYTWGPKGRLVLEEVEPSAEEGAAAPAGQVLSTGAGVEIVCGRGRLRLVRVRPEGRRAMDAASAANGRFLVPGERLGGGPGSEA